MLLLLLATLLPIVSVLHPASALARPATALAWPSAAAAITCQSTAHDYCRRSSVRMDAVVAEGTSVITCGRCKAAYAVAPDAFGPVGKQVRCSNCGHEWFQSASRVSPVPPGMELVEYPAEMKARMAAGKPAEAVSRFRCFVGNLAFVATEDELRSLFEQFGTVVSVTVMTDETGRPKGFGFVNMESPVAGAKAIAELSGYELHGRNIEVSEGKQSESRGRGRGRGEGRGDGRGRGEPREFRNDGPRSEGRGGRDFESRGRGDGRGRGRGDGRGRGGGRGGGRDFERD